MTDPAAENPAPASLDLVGLAGRITAAFVAHQRIASDDVPALIVSIHGALAGLATPVAPADDIASAVAPRAVSPRKSLVDRDWIVSMIDGKRYRSLKRHIGAHGLTPDDYRARYGLPASYPMVAPGYSEARSAIATARGLGRKNPVAPPVATAPAAPETPAPKRRGRPRKTA